MAFNQQEIAKLIVNGREYTRWESIWVQERWAEPFSYFRFVAEEGKILPTNWNDLQYKPGDRCSIQLGGQQIIEGTIITRQTAVNATQHMVQLTGKSRAFWQYKSSVFNKTGNFDGMNFQQIMEKVLEPMGVKPVVYPGSKPNPEPFIKAQADIGMKIWDYLEKLAREKKIVIGVNRQGMPLIIGDHKGTVMGRVADGDNILSLQATISIEDTFMDIDVSASNQGSDDNNMTKASQIQGHASGTAPEPSLILIPMEHPPNDAGSAQRRAEYEKIWTEGTKITANVTVQGWFSQDGGLWEAGKDVTIRSPMSMLGGVLKIRTATFQQDNTNGTTTTLELVAPWALLDSVNLDISDANSSVPSRPPTNQPRQLKPG
jgi:prophage tail gpP-like protein